MIREFFRLEASAGILLGFTAILAIIIENSPFRIFYDYLLTTPVVIQIGNFAIDKPLLLWINGNILSVNWIRNKARSY